MENKDNFSKIFFCADSFFGINSAFPGIRIFCSSWYQNGILFLTRIYPAFRQKEGKVESPSCIAIFQLPSAQNNVPKQHIWGCMF